MNTTLLQNSWVFGLVCVLRVIRVPARVTCSHLIGGRGDTLLCSFVLKLCSLFDTDEFFLRYITSPENLFPYMIL